VFEITSAGYVNI